MLDLRWNRKVRTAATLNLSACACIGDDALNAVFAQPLARLRELRLDDLDEITGEAFLEATFRVDPRGASRESR